MLAAMSCAFSAAIPLGSWPHTQELLHDRIAAISLYATGEDLNTTGIADPFQNAFARYFGRPGP